MGGKRHGEKGWRRSSTDRRQIDNPPYRGSERRSREDRRVVKGFAICVLSSFILISTTDTVQAGRRPSDQIRPQTKVLLIQQPAVHTAALPPAAQNNYKLPGIDNTERSLMASLLPQDTLMEINATKDLEVEAGVKHLLNEYDVSSEGRKTQVKAAERLNLNMNSFFSKRHLLLKRPILTYSYNSGKVNHRPLTTGAFDFEMSSVLKGTVGTGVISVGAAFATNVFLHELGHAIIADYVEAEGSKLRFLQSKNGQFFLASSTVEAIDERSRLPYNMGGEWAADKTFEYALKRYREGPSLYNKSLLFFSGTDLLWYSLYAFYLSHGHNELDPIAITTYNDISRETVLLVALSKTILNAYRIYSGNDRVIPSFTVDKESVVVNLRMVF